MSKFKNILWGIVLILIGIVVGSNALGITNIDIFFRGWWTLIIIIPCFINLFQENDKVSNLIGLAIGVALLLSCQGILSFRLVMKLIVPIVLIIVGISFIFKDTIGGKVSQEIKKLNQNRGNTNEYCATFSGQDVKFDNEIFKGAELTAVFGGVKCDLRKSIIEADQVINASSIFGGIDIYMPDNVKVKVNSTSIFGGVSDDRKYTEKEEANTIYINATCIFGGVSIK